MIAGLRAVGPASLLLFAGIVQAAGFVAPYQASQGGHEGEKVLWGGYIVAHVSVHRQMCTEVRASRLNARGELTGADGQRFLACDIGGRVGEDYRIGRRAVFAGKLDRVVSRVEKMFCDPTTMPEEYRGTRFERAKKGGCRIWLPVVAVTDSKVWKETVPRR